MLFIYVMVVRGWRLTHLMHTNTCTLNMAVEPISCGLKLNSARPPYCGAVYNYDITDLWQGVPLCTEYLVYHQFSYKSVFSNIIKFHYMNDNDSLFTGCLTVDYATRYNAIRYDTRLHATTVLRGLRALVHYVFNHGEVQY